MRGKNLNKTNVLLKEQMFDKLNGKNLEVLELFMAYPRREFYLREIARILKISTSTTKIALDRLKEHNLIREEKKANLRLFVANTDSQLFRQFKITKNIKLIEEKNLVKRLVNEDVISMVLFGSYAQGTNTEKSDIDILMIVRKRIPIKIMHINGSELQVIQKTPEEFRELKKKDNPFYTEIITTGISLFGGMPL